MDKLCMFKFFVKKIMKVAKKFFSKVLWHFRSRSFLEFSIELSLLWFCFILLLLWFLAAFVNTSAAELPDQIINAAQLPEQSDLEQSDSEHPAATPVIDYTDKFDNLESSLNMLSEYMDNIQADLTDLKGSVSGNDIDYSDQLDDLQDKLTDLSDDVAAILDSATVSENTVSENSLISTPLDDLTFDQQMLVSVICIMFVLLFILVIYSFL